MSPDEQLLAASRAAFMEESREMIDQFEQALLALEEQPQDQEQLNAAFRAAHTIKGSSGLFGYQAVVEFTHGVEAVLDGLRAGRLPVTEPTIAQLLRAHDRIAAMIGEIAAGAADATAAPADELRALDALYGAPAGPAGAGPQPVRAADHGTPASAGHWHVSLRFRPDAIRNGFDPASFIRYLPRIGHVERIVTLDHAVPALEGIDPEACYLGFEIRLAGPTDRATIENVFEFVQDDCVLNILPPGAHVEQYLELIEQYGEGDPAAGSRLGDVLVAVGAITARERDALLARQQALAHDGAPAPRLGELAVARGAAAPVVVQAAVARQETLRERRSEENRTIRVSADKLDRLIDLIGELVIAGSGARLAAREEGSARFAEAAQRIEALVEQARDGALQLRMVQIGETLARFHRVVRDTARKLGKDIDLIVTGGETELDKSMVELIADPLMHLVRNSLDHGLEPPAERRAAGKPPRGRLAINACHESGSIVIEVSDDGRGLNRDRILAKAVERGIVVPGPALDEDEVHQLIFAPGFSTADQVTDISGRGVGMDVVKRNIEALRGTVRLASRPGQGTTTQIRLPLTLAIIDGFLVEVAAARFIIPLDRVVECIERPASARVGADPCSGHFDLRAEVLPYLDVRRYFGTTGAAEGRQSTVVVRSGAMKVGLMVDRLLGEHQTVIKPLGNLLGGLKGIAGSTILGSGEVALILDVEALVQRAMSMARGRGRGGSRPGLAAEATAGAAALPGAA